MTREKTKAILAELEERFLDGERMTIDTVIEEHFKTENRLSYLTAKGAVLGWMNNMKRRMTIDHDLWFGIVNDSQEYGIALNEAEYMYVLIRYYMRIKGNLKRAVQVRGEALGKGLLANTEMKLIELPTPPKENQGE